MGTSKFNKKIIIAAVLVAVLLGGLAFNYYSGFTRNTENAYINADVVSVAAQVAGRVVSLHVKENQRVHQGDPLFEIDAQPYAIALARAEAALATAEQSARQDHAEVGVARAQVTQAETDLANRITRVRLEFNSRMVGKRLLPMRQAKELVGRLHTPPNSPFKNSPTLPITKPRVRG